MLARTISLCKGKGSVGHNTRAFHADNVDETRSSQNICFVNQDIREAYHHLFDGALERYNAKQKRSDRKISDYYEKIRTGKQEKLFHELVIQVGDKDSMSAIGEHSELSKQILIEYMEDFMERNKGLHVFSAHLHMDEATPHLHIDYIPYATECKRGLDTRVSLKLALENLGFKSTSRNDTELMQWQNNEKKKLSEIMLSHNVEWEKKGTHREHLSVYDFKKEQRALEVEVLDTTITLKTQEVEKLTEKVHEKVDTAIGWETISKETEKKVAEKKSVLQEVTKQTTEKLTESKNLDAVLEQKRENLKEFISCEDEMIENRDKLETDITNLEQKKDVLALDVKKFEAKTQKIKEKETELIDIKNIEVRPHKVLMKKTDELIIHEEDFSNLRKLAKKQVVSENIDKAKDKEIIELKKKVIKLEEKTEQQEEMISAQTTTISNLTKDKTKLKNELEKYKKFVQNFDLQEQFQKFLDTLKQQIKKKSQER